MSLSLEDGEQPFAPAVARAEEAVCVSAGAAVGCSETFRSNLDSAAACRMLLQCCCMQLRNVAAMLLHAAAETVRLVAASETSYSSAALELLLPCGTSGTSGRDNSRNACGRLASCIAAGFNSLTSPTECLSRPVAMHSCQARASTVTCGKRALGSASASKGYRRSIRKCAGGGGGGGKQAATQKMSVG